MRRTVPKPFAIVFNPTSQPGYQTRNASLDRFQGGANIVGGMPTKQMRAGEVEENLRVKFGSGQAAQLLPSAMSKGKK